MNWTYQRKGKLLQTIVVPTVLQKEVLRAVHLTHFGISKCFERLKREYFWLGMFGDLKNFVLSCDRCAREKNSRQKRYPTGKTFIPFQPGTDLFADITYVKDSNHYILTIICSYSKYLATYLLTNIKATTIAEKFIDYFTRFSKPVSIQTDLGTQFTSEIFQEINRILGVELKNSLAYSAFQNGKIERCHASLKNTLATLKLDKYSLDLRVKLHTSFYNTSFHEAISAIPSEIFFGREMPALLDNNVALVERTQLSVDSYVHKMSRELKTVYADVRRELIERQVKQMENLEKKSTKIAPMIGDSVFVVNEGIFTKGFDGPYTVVCLNSKSIVTLNDKKTNRDFKISISKIKIIPQRREHLL